MFGFALTFIVIPNKSPLNICFCYTFKTLINNLGIEDFKNVPCVFFVWEKDKMTPLTFHEIKHAAPEDESYLELVPFPVHRGQQKLLIFRLAFQVLLAD